MGQERPRFIPGCGPRWYRGLRFLVQALRPCRRRHHGAGGMDRGDGRIVVPVGGPVTFGPLFTLDGVHPSSETHRLVADSLISTVNQTFGTTIPLLP